MRRGAAAILAAALVGCAPRAPVREAATLAASGPRHLQILRRLSAAERRDAFDRFAKRNGGAWGWEGPDQIDAFLGHVVAAHRSDAPVLEPSPALEEAALLDAAERFLARNADLLGLAPSDLPKVDVEVAPGTGATRTVLVRGELPRRGYLAFPSVASNLRILLTVGPDGQVRSIANASTMHPALALGLDPLLSPDDPRVVRHVVGRPVFALVATREAAALAETIPATRARLPRLPLGEVREADVRRVRLDIHVSDAPMGAWRSYRLVWAVEVLKRRPDPETAAFFTFVVDADTGDLVEDARVPILDPEAP